MEKQQPFHEILQKISSTHQKRFALYSDYVECFEIHNTKSEEYKFRFEHISDKPLNLKNREIAEKALFSTILCIFLLLIISLSKTKNSAGLIPIIGLAAGLYKYFENRNKFLIYSIVDGKELAFLPASPSKAEFNIFIDNMLSLREVYLKKISQKGRYDDMTSELSKFHFLKEQGAITEEEFLKIKNDLLKDITGEKKSPGFLN